MTWVLLIFTLFDGAAFKARLILSKIRCEINRNAPHPLDHLWITSEVGMPSTCCQNVCVCVHVHAHAQTCIHPSMSAINMHEATWVNWDRKCVCVCVHGEPFASCCHHVIFGYSVTFLWHFICISVKLLLCPYSSCCPERLLVWGHMTLVNFGLFYCNVHLLALTKNYFFIFVHIIVVAVT